MIDVSAYTQQPEVTETIASLRRRIAAGAGLSLSNIRNEAGNQYVDLVMEGGGTLGVALLGYIYVLEQLDIRFLKVAGTSAGSIVAMLLGGGGPIAQAKSEWLIEKVAGKDFYDFIDGDEGVRAFVDAMLDPEARKRKKARLTPKVLDDLKDYYGLNPGVHFHEWMKGLLAERGVHNVNEMNQLRTIAPAGIRDVRTNAPCPPERWRRVSVVAADITTGVKVSLPDMAHLYWADPGLVNPADFVRASMSVPVFFYPFTVENLPNQAGTKEAWDRDGNYRGPIPPKVHFVDGGAMSNFPMSLFYEPSGNADAPVLGIQIGISRDSYNACDTFGAFAGAMLGSMMAFYDNDFFVQHPEMNRFVGVIDTGEYNWLDFSIDDAGKIDLFVRGVRAAKNFMMTFFENPIT